MKLSQSFFLHEFTRSQTAARMGRAVEASTDIALRLAWGCYTILQPLRDRIGATITINSGYRPPWLNEAVKGSDKSQHMLGQAADIIAVGFTPFNLCRQVINYGLPFDQLILEFDSWTHVSWALPGETPRGQVLTYRTIDGTTRVLSGLEPQQET